MTKFRTALFRGVAKGTRIWGDRWNARPLRAIFPSNLDNAIEEIVDCRGIRLRLSTASALEWNIYFYSWQWYEPEIRAAIVANLHPGDQAIDVGANIGLHTISIAKACGSAGCVVACEPNPAVVPRLEENLRLNGLQNVAIVPKAVNSRGGPTVLQVPNDVVGLQAWASLRDSQDQYLTDSHTIPVSGTTLDEIASEFNLNRVRLIKIDTEGFEPEVLYGGEALLTHQRPVLLFEYTKLWWAKNGNSLQKVRGLLESWGYGALCEISADGSRPIGPDIETANIVARTTIES